MRVVKDQVAVKIPATSANLGPGFDSCGLALGLYNHVQVRAVTGQTRVTVRGSGAGEIPEDETNLVVRSLRMGLDYVGAPQVGVDMTCINNVPQARGLGSSAAAIVGGLWVAHSLIENPQALDEQTIFQLATQLEGHPDNVAPAVFGGYTVSWMEGEEAHHVRLDPHPDLEVTVFIPDLELSTKVARELLPDSVPYRDAVFNAGRSALLSAAITAFPNQLLAATDDRLHQPYRRDAMESSAALVGWLRGHGLPAAISGAGPTVIVLSKVPKEIILQARNNDWTVHCLEPSAKGAYIIESK